MGNNPVSVEGVTMARIVACLLFTIILGITFLFSCQISRAEEEGVADLSSMKKTMVGVSYYQNMFGLVHQNPSRYSMALTTISCGQPIQMYQLTSKQGQSVQLPEGWMLVKVGAYDGYLPKEHLSRNRISCFQDRYPKFFEGFELELTDLYYWGRLYDHYLWGKSKVR
jgi:hypothetical protein